MQSKIEKEILRYLEDKAPNYLNWDMIKPHLTEYAKENFESAINKLVGEELVEHKIDPRPRISSAPVNYYRIKNYGDLHIEESIKLGNIKVPRLLAVSVPSVFPEHLNCAIESLAEYTADVDKQSEKRIKKYQRDFWAKTISVFTILVGFLAIVFRGIPEATTMNVDTLDDFWNMLGQNTVQLLPLTFIFVLFTFVSWLIVKHL